MQFAGRLNWPRFAAETDRVKLTKTEGSERVGVGLINITLFYNCLGGYHALVPSIRRRYSVRVHTTRAGTTVPLSDKFYLKG